MLIESATRQLDPSNVFQGETDEVYEKFCKSIAMLELFMASFEQVRNNLPSYFPPDIEPVPWTFHPRNVFQRLMDFTDRLKLIKTVLGAALEFSKLEKVEIGGIKGKVLSQKCNDVLSDFNEVYMHMANIQYELLDPADHQINADYEIFKQKCDDLDRRLAAVFAQAFDDCYNLESCYKLIHVIGILIERPLIAAEVLPKYPIIIDMLNEQLDTVKVLFDKGRYDPPIDKYYPPVAGTLLWLHKLAERIRVPVEDFKLLESDIVTGEDGVHVLEKYNQMIEILETEGRELFAKWASTVDDQIIKSLMKMQLTRNETTMLLNNNFDPELEAILREVKYMKIIGIPNIPQLALDLYERNDELHGVVTELNRIVEWYNALRTETLPVEFELIKDELSTIDLMLQQLTDSTTWESDSKY